MILHLVAQKAFPEWNKQSINERDIRRVCKKKGVRIVEGDVGREGLYIIYRGIPFIVIHPGLSGPMRLWVLLHELFHHLLHVPGLQLFDSRFKTKADYEANLLAAVSLIPLYMVKTKTFAELEEDFGFPKELLWIRKEVYERYGF
jgi:Zn-dependent peptidase ImmA (M78 family)